MLFDKSIEFQHLTNEQIEIFLKKRRFEDDSIEFKKQFKKEKNGKFDFKHICRNIVAFSNAVGGYLFYGILDKINDESEKLEHCVNGLSDDKPSNEDLGGWFREYIKPSVYAQIRTFNVFDKTILVIKIPEGANKPYRYYSSTEKSQIFFIRRAARIDRLNYQETNDFYHEIILARHGLSRFEKEKNELENIRSKESSMIIEHKNWVIEQIEDTMFHGRVSIYGMPIDIQEGLKIDKVKNLLEGEKRFSEAFYHAESATIFQNGITKGYFPRAIKPDIKSSCRWTIYRSGFCAFDSQLDHLFNENKVLNPNWFSYELQRTLQLFQHVLQDNVSEINITIEFGNLIGWNLETYNHRVTRHPFTGISKPINKEIKLKNIHTGDDNWSVFMPIIKEIMDEIATMFGLDRMIIPSWDDKGVFKYYNFHPSTR